MQIIRNISIIALAGIALTATQSAWADDWVAERLRGSVLVFHQDEWVPLKRGDVVSDDSYIKTLGNGRVHFTRGAESIDLAGHTLIQILDKDGQKFTNVHQHYGQVAVEAERRDVEHFAIVTPYLAAIVKGTQFVVQSGHAGANVSVGRGQVNVSDPETGTNVDITPGQSTSVDPSGHFAVSASGGVELPTLRHAGAVIQSQEVSAAANNGSGNGRGNGGDGDGGGSGRDNGGGNGGGSGRGNGGGDGGDNRRGNGGGHGGGNGGGNGGDNGGDNGGGNGGGSGRGNGGDNGPGNGGGNGGDNGGGSGGGNGGGSGGGNGGDNGRGNDGGNGNGKKD